MKFNCSQRLLISLVLAFIYLCYPATGFGTATCYLPDGSVAEDDAPCYDTLPSQCCPTADGICLSNGLCFSTTDNVVARSSCTDQTWKSHGCSSFCTTSEAFLFLNTFVILKLMPQQLILTSFARSHLVEATCSVAARVHQRTTAV
jgi:hypothetical protein